MLTLATLCPGETADVTGLDGNDPVTIRLYEMGLMPGERVAVLGRAPFGDPMAIRVRGCRLAVRRCDAQRVHVQRLPAGEFTNVASAAALNRS